MLRIIILDVAGWTGFMKYKALLRSRNGHAQSTKSENKRQSINTLNANQCKLSTLPITLSSIVESLFFSQDINFLWSFYSLLLDKIKFI